MAPYTIGPEKKRSRPGTVGAWPRDRAFRSRPETESLSEQIGPDQGATLDAEAADQTVLASAPRPFPPDHPTGPAVTGPVAQENDNKSPAGDSHPDPGSERSKWNPIFLIITLLVAGLAFYAYWHRTIYPQIYQEAPSQTEVDRQ